MYRSEHYVRDREYDVGRRHVINGLSLITLEIFQRHKGSWVTYVIASTQIALPGKLGFG